MGSDVLPAELWQPGPPYSNEGVCQLLLLYGHISPHKRDPSFPIQAAGKGSSDP